MSSTGMSIAILERHIQPQWSRFDALVSPVGLAAKRWLAMCFLEIEKNPKLLDHPVQEHLRFLNTSATLGLEPSGPLGQLFAIPFGGKHPCIQPVIGYKGMNTMAGRAGIIIHGGIIREGDEWNREIGAGVPFKMRLGSGNRQGEPIKEAWAQGELPNGRMTTAVVLDMSELAAVKAKSPGARKADSPWNDARGPGFAAMCEKTAKRRLQRHLPALLTVGLEAMNISQHHLGAAVETGHEDMGLHTFIDDKATVVHGTLIDGGGEPEGDKPAAHLFRIERSKEGPLNCADIEEWRETLLRGIAAAAQPNPIRGMMERNEAVFDVLWQADHERDVQLVRDAAETKITDLES